MIRCCLCGSDDGTVLWCSVCEHYFCRTCRYRWFRRGVEFVKELLGRSRLECNHASALGA